MVQRATVLTKTVSSLAEAEDLVARLWVCIERYDLDMCALRVDIGFGITVTAEFRPSMMMELVLDELGAEAV
jgi:hypothetical protein